MAGRIKKKEHENLTETNIKHVIALLNPEEGKPITKKEACNVLKISYNTARLNKIIADYHEQAEYRETRKNQNKGKAATKFEIQEACEEYLKGENITNIAKRLNSYDEDGIHPGLEANQQWANCVVKHLTQKNII